MSCPRPNTPRSDAKDLGQLREPVRSRLYTAFLDAPRKGLVLVSGLRDPGRQWDLRHERCRGRECDPSCRGYPATATPAKFVDGEWVGGSHHQTGRAGDVGGRDLDWLIAHRFEYGLGLTVSSENWHFEADGIDSRTHRRIPAPTRRIIQYPTGNPAPALPPTGDLTVADISTITDLLERLIASITRIEAGLKLNKSVALRSKTDGRVWIVGGAGRWWCRSRTALDLLLYTGQIQPIGTDGPAIVDQTWLDGISEIASPEGADAL